LLIRRQARGALSAGLFAFRMVGRRVRRSLIFKQGAHCGVSGALAIE